MNYKQILSQLTLEEKAGLLSGSGFWHTKAVKRLNIPKVMMCDGPHGLRKQKGEEDHLGFNESVEAVCFPTASAMASSFDPELMHKLGEALGDECLAEGIAMLLGPGLNMKRSPLCGRNFEYFSEDPLLAGELATSFVKGLQSRGVAACVKHFAANNQETRRMNANSIVDERTLHEIYLPAFERVVKDGKTRSVMCAYNQVNGSFCAENRKLLTEILRKRWGFEGFVVTDWGAIKDRVKGVQAGLDLEMPGSDEKQIPEQFLIKAVQDGRLLEADLDRAVLNVLKFVLESPASEDSKVAFDRSKDHEMAVAAARECAVLMKNEDILPLNSAQKLLFVGAFAQQPRYQGAGSSHVNAYRVDSALDAAGEQVQYAQGYHEVPCKADHELLMQAVAQAAEAEVAVIFAGLPGGYESEGFDRKHMQMPDNQNALIRAVAAVQPNTVVVLHGGAPMEMPWVDQVKAVLCMYLAGEGVGRATVDLLFGRAVPSGKLAETWPVKLSDNPSYLSFPGEEGIVPYCEGIYIGYRYYDKKQMPVQFPFGHGLSYTDFVYEDLKLDQEYMSDTDTLTVRCTVRNTGQVAAKEVVQLYVGDVESSVGRPVRELKAFRKVQLAPGEAQQLSFVLSKRAFAYYEPRIQDWYVESGAFRIEVGASSRDIRLQAEVRVEATKALPIVFDINSPLGLVMTHPRGQELLSSMRPQTVEGATDAMGEGADEMVQAMMEEMPLGSLLNFGMVTEEQLTDIIETLNEGAET